jgi:hypothetical protein
MTSDPDATVQSPEAVRRSLTAGQREAGRPSVPETHSGGGPTTSITNPLSAWLRRHLARLVMSETAPTGAERRLPSAAQRRTARRPSFNAAVPSFDAHLRRVACGTAHPEAWGRLSRGRSRTSRALQRNSRGRGPAQLQCAPQAPLTETCSRFGDECGLGESR